MRRVAFVSIIGYLVANFIGRVRSVVAFRVFGVFGI
ncbi:MAG: Hypothetical protein BHV28_05700 [Candidatus Tokpelaia hoelldobleri]|uniref:Uncharacterized protein n=1 Tax=Candidatus Tokpelaia hoelldobleri TaxID=1902579 RepID=A0A1U9JTT5_9HYPH|nr:MAG: Hypothetical protein BHV28_05700 [Candidatus Tokpelaia hoelldoblerii]